MSQRPNYFVSMLKMKCPHCRRGHMFKQQNPFHWRFSKIFDMYERCPVCNQKFELETGFWFGTGYVSYALGIALSVFNLIWYWLFFGMSWQDDSLYWWLGINSVILIGLQPWLMRISRVIYLYFFVYYDEDTAQLPDPGQPHDHTHS